MTVADGSCIVSLSHLCAALSCWWSLSDMVTLSGSPGLAGTIEQYASGAVDPRPIVAATVGLAAVSDVLAGRRPAGAGDGPKFHVDPRR